jgi:hypothetical protein
VNPLGLERARGAHADERVRALEGVRKGSAHAGVVPRELVLVRVAVLAGGVEDAVLVARDDAPDEALAGIEAEEPAADGVARGPGAVHHHAEGLEGLSHDPGRVEEGGVRDGGGSVLVVVHHGDAEVLEARLHLEALGRGDVLQVDAAEVRSDRARHPHDALHVVLLHAEGERVQAGELLEENALALHHRQGGGRADVPQAEYGAPIREHGDGSGLEGELPRLAGVLVDGAAGFRDAGRVEERELAARLHLEERARLELAVKLAVERERLRVHVVGRHAC